MSCAVTHMANLLVTNDDGVESKLWSRLCDALQAAGHHVYGLAPARDQSWISSAQTISRELMASEISPGRFSLDGTPSDCAAVAPALWPGVAFDAVVSGINIGVNTRLPLVLTSGTVGAASTGAMLGYRAIAFSYAMPREFSAEAKKNGGLVPQTLASTDSMIAHCVARVSRLLGEPNVFGRVLNVNFPSAVTAQTAWETTSLALTPMLQYFKKTDSGKFIHDPKLGQPLNAGRTEFHVIGEGKVSETVIDWPSIGYSNAATSRATSVASQ